ncbi:MAG: alpha/beta fold hydrolase [Hyphomonadaceae bacterium]
MPYAENGAAKIYYETEGAGAPLLLIHGFTAQLVGWRAGLKAALVRAGFRLILLDNRDVGLSQKFGGPDDVDGGYDLSDMARDCVSVLDALGVGKAHVMGQSMGGMIAQLMALEHPDRTASAVFVYTTPNQGFRVGPQPSPHPMSLRPERLAREAAIAAWLERERECRSTAYMFDESWAATLGALNFDRSYAPDGNARQFHAMRRSYDRLPRLGEITLPTAILHGREDRLLEYNGSIAMAQAIPGAELHLYPGMGHELPAPLWEEFAAIARRTAARAEA